MIPCCRVNTRDNSEVLEVLLKQELSSVRQFAFDTCDFAVSVPEPTYSWPVESAAWQRNMFGSGRFITQPAAVWPRT